MMKKYTVGEAAEALGVSRGSLKGWERSGLISPSKRERRGSLEWRYYDETDLKRIREEMCLPPRILPLDPNRTIAEVADDVLENLCGERSGDKSFSVTLTVIRLPNGSFCLDPVEAGWFVESEVYYLGDGELEEEGVG